MLKFLCRNSCLERNCGCRKRIVDVEFSRDVDSDRNLMGSADVKLDSDKIRLRHIVEVLCLVRRICAHAKSRPLARNVLHNLLEMLIVNIDKRKPALYKDLLLVVQILCKIRMLIRSDVIRGNVRENSIVKCDSGYAVHLKCLGGNLHHTAVASLLDHLSEIAMQIIGLRCRVHRRVVILTDVNSVRSDHSGLFSGCLHDLSDHVRRRRLSLCSGHSDHQKLLCRIAKACS